MTQLDVVKHEKLDGRFSGRQEIRRKPTFSRTCFCMDISGDTLDMSRMISISCTFFTSPGSPIVQVDASI
jgi:hypothetical protein